MHRPLPPPYAPPGALPNPPAPQGPPPASLLELSEQQKLSQQHRQGAGWFLWVAVLSQLNSLFMLLNINFAFCLGLGISPLVAVIASAVEVFGAPSIITNMDFMF